MASAILINSLQSFDRSDKLRSIASDRTISITGTGRSAIYESAFVLAVASWDAYILNASKVACEAIADQVRPTQPTVALLINRNCRQVLSRLNTPNADTARETLCRLIDYDPWPDWTWPQSSLTPLAIRSQLNEITKVRHAIAHGSQLPVFTWNQDRLGRVRMNSSVVRGCTALLRSLCRQTDRGLRRHLRRVYAITNW